MAAAELKPVYLLSGSDRPKIARALRRLRDRIGDDATEHLNAREATGDDAVAACNAMGLFVGNGRLVIVDEADRWKVDDATAVAAYLTAPAPATVLALVGQEIKADSALAKAVKKAGELLTYDVPKRKVPEWVAEQFARLGAKADRDACRALVEVVGDDLDDLASEIDKLALWAGDTPVTVAVVEELAVGRAETPIFSLTDAWGRRDVAAVLTNTESLLERTHRTRSGELLRILASLVAHIGRVRRIQRLADEGVPARDAAGKLKMHPFAAEKAYGQAGNFSADELSLAMVRLAELDAAAKGGSRMPADLELARALIDVTRRAG
ncbi:MAG: DNA polymerase III subunit delta [Acidobacteriota bacterium]|nr:DNA polymerase III subunit delta [Acidobacteriota bacterium]